MIAGHSRSSQDHLVAVDPPGFQVADEKRKRILASTLWMSHRSRLPCAVATAK